MDAISLNGTKSYAERADDGDAAEHCCAVFLWRRSVVIGCVLKARHLTRRVLPIRPGPVSVSNCAGVRHKMSWIAASSRSRPISAVAWGQIVASSGLKSAPSAAGRRKDMCDPTVRGSASWPIAKSTVPARLCPVSGRPAGQPTGNPTQHHTADWHLSGPAPVTLVAVD
jgi:hypothetical protein